MSGPAVPERIRQTGNGSGVDRIPVYQFRHTEKKHTQKKDDLAKRFRRQRPVRDAIVFIRVAQVKAQAFQGRKIIGQFQFDRDKTVYVNHYYFYNDDVWPPVHQGLQLRAVEHQAVPERALMGETATGEARHPL